MSLHLYYGPGACSFIPHVALRLIEQRTGQPFEATMVRMHKGEHRQEAFLRINPNGQVPALVDDGQTVTQIVAIISHLARRFPQAGLLPQEVWARTRALETLAWFNNTVHPTFTRIFMPSRIVADEAAQAVVRTEAVGAYRALMAQVQERVQALGDAFLDGAEAGPCDAYALTTTRWATMGGIDVATEMPALWTYVERVAAQPAVAATIAAEGLTLNMFKKSS
ncbi:glutathione S-transferase family protein [Amphibiibacter pelophylacis]|uniref:Glutathione S-transferase N-terminal domain-containing protein n=1 Tax=Amphibiibacter pelophylacis TaxID=1799477 RepID=A0ACC6P5I3_9BURK